MPKKVVPATGFHTNPERINRKGRPKGEDTIAAEMRKLLEEEALSDKKATGKSHRRIFVESVLAAALKGNARAAQLLWNHIDGSPIQKLIHSGDNEDDPISITQIFVPKKKKAGDG